MCVSRSHLVLTFLSAFVLGACADSDLPQEPVEDVPDASQLNAVSKTIVTYDDHLAAIDVDGFAGLYVNDAGRAVVRSTRSDPDLSRLADAVSATLAAGQQVAPPGITGAVVEPAQFTFKELFEWKKTIGTQLDDEAIVTLDANERTNRVEIGVLSGTDIDELRSRVVRLGVPENAISVVERGAVQFDQTLRDKVRDTVGGLRLVGPGTCTLGFNANWGAERVLVTASHCTFGQGGVQAGEFFQPNIDTGGPAAFGPWVPPGNVVGVEIADPVWEPCPPFGTPCRYSDAALIRYYGGVGSDLGKIAKTAGVGSIQISSSTPRWTIVGEEAMLPGQMAHRVGQTTGYQFGEVAGTCVDVTTTSGFRVLCSTTYDASSAGGDSGSPVFRVVGSNSARLAGIHWGNTLPNGPSWFSPIALIRQELETSLQPLTTH
jgi:hypothetical protein